MSHSSLPAGSPPHPSPRSLGAPTRSLAQARDSHGAYVTDHAQQAPRGPTSLPSLATITAGGEQPPSSSPTAWRSGGLQSILNPSDGHTAERPRTAFSSDLRAGAAHQALPPPQYGSPRVRKRGESPSPAVDHDINSHPRPGRRILTPRSPGLRAASIGTYRSPSRGPAVGARTSMHGLEGRAYYIEPGSHADAAVPPLPPLPVTRSPHSAHQTSDHEVSGGRPPISHAPSYSRGHVQPVSSGPPRSQTPTYGGHQPASPSYQSGPSTVIRSPVMSSEGQAGFPVLHGSSMGQNLPRVQSGWKMALETQQGREVVDINIDYQQASKMADEKRKRNAGASARFRARRKEKEKESSQLISGLQQDLRDISDERDFYLNERNFYRDLVARSIPGPLPSRPPSPHFRRRPSMAHSIETSSGPEYGIHDVVEAPPQRRRTGDYQSFAAPLPPPPPLTNNNNHPYTTPYPGPATPFSHPNPGSAGPYPSDVRGQGGPPPPPSPHPTLAPARMPDMDPYRRDIIDRWQPPKP